MEYCKGGAVVDMLHKCKNKSEKTISFIIKQLLSALSYMHSQNIAHRDIKLDNIVFLHPDLTQSSHSDNIPIKIIDFGTAVTY
jgi:serine/threonine protein kinase